MFATIVVDTPHYPGGSMSATENYYFFTIAAITVMVCLGWGIVKMIRSRSPVLLFCLLGSVLCNPVEPIWDALGKLRFHPGTDAAFTMFPNLDVPVHYPWWALLVYVEFSGLACYLFYRVFDSGFRGWKFWGLAVGGQAMMNFVLEGFVITSAYDYYGYQPWRFFSDFPLWWVFTNYGELLGGILLFAAIARFGKVRGSLLAVIIVPSSFAAWELWTGWPTFAAINSNIGPVLQNVAAFVTAGIAFATIWLIYRVAEQYRSDRRSVEVTVSGPQSALERA